MWGKNIRGCLGIGRLEDQYFPWRVRLRSAGRGVRVHSAAGQQGSLLPGPGAGQMPPAAGTGEPPGGASHRPGPVRL